MAWPKGVKRGPRVPVDPNVVPSTPPVVDKVTDAVDRKLDFFQYSNEATSYEWEKENPINVPKDIQEKYPGLAFKWRAKDPKTGLRRGNSYRGWQVFTDKTHPTGVEYGGDLVLCAMPEERAQGYRDYVQRQSTEQVRALQEEQLAQIERAGAELKDAEFEALEPGRVVSNRGAQSPPVGISVGARELKQGSRQYRGMHPEEIAERVIKQKEQAARGRKYFT